MTHDPKAFERDMPKHVHRPRTNEHSLKARRSMAIKSSERQRVVPPPKLPVPPWVDQE